MSVMRTDVSLDGLIHECDDPDCHVPGFITTLMRLRRDREVEPTEHDHSVEVEQT
jgi:hypothetical protein